MKLLRFTLPLSLCLARVARFVPTSGAPWRLSALRAGVYGLFAAYLLAGTFGRFPWKADEPYSFAIAWNAVSHDRWLIPHIGDDPFLEKPPLFFWLGALCVRLFPWLAPHEAARLAVLACLGVTLWGFCRALKTVYGEIAQPTLSAPAWRFCGIALLATNLGLAEHIHKFTADLGQLAGAMVALAALMAAVSSRDAPSYQRTLMHGGSFGAGIGIALLSKGMLMPGVLFAVWACCLPWLPALRGRRGAAFILCAGLALLPFAVPWPLALYSAAPDLFYEWFWVNNIGRFAGFTSLGGHDNPLLDRLFAVVLAGAPASLLLIKGAMTGLIALARRARSLRPGGRALAAAFRRYPARSVAAVYLAVGLATLLSSGSMRDIYLMPFLPAMALLALGLLPAGQPWHRLAARALDGLFLLLLLVIVVTALQLYHAGTPRLLHGLWPNIDSQLPTPFWLIPDGPSLGLACLVLALWAGVTCRRKPNLLCSWAAGMTAVWSVALLLLLPWLDAARSYHQPFAQLRPLLTSPHCLATDGLGESELGMLHYLTGVAGRRIYAGHSGQGEPGHLNEAALGCDFLLVQQAQEARIAPPAPAWRRIWSGQRPADDRLFILYRARRDPGHAVPAALPPAPR
ncbi:ArnT family glycosyltransferase [Sodalis sp. (in: enterobacteria)]|uniref:ArnT family glycosyltransferase n=1 Tax=Sodalis sp. (in: enterobacteria) TaxID=1898979 RepID=UPI003F3D5ED7